jgi:tetratricopeptide (TPR) repeat protein
MAALMAAAELKGYSHRVAGFSLRDVGLPQRLAQASHCEIFFLIKTIVPTGLMAYVELPKHSATLPFPWGLEAAAALAITTGFFLGRRRFPGGLSVWVHYTACLLPVSGLIQFSQVLVADRYGYLACAGWAILFGGLLTRYAAPSAESKGAARVLFPVLLAALLALLGLASWTQAFAWRDDESLWRQELTVDPSQASARYNLANLLAAQGRTDEAVEQYRAVLEIAPEKVEAYVNLGETLAEAGRLEQATGYLQRAVAIAPANASARVNLGDVLAALGRKDEAKSELGRAIELDPGRAAAHNDLGVLLASEGDFQGAAAHFRKALEIDPGFAAARDNLARATRESGR